MASTMVKRSTQVRDPHAAAIPSGSETSSATSMVEAASDSVGSIRWAISEEIGMLLMMECPISPCSRVPTQMKNCSSNGRSSPRLTRMRSMSATDACSPAITAAGSPGVRRSNRNTNTATMTTTGTVASRRRKI
ncbi:hypothetical protein D3C71_1621560 [compost metagenome]